MKRVWHRVLSSSSGVVVGFVLAVAVGMQSNPARAQVRPTLEILERPAVRFFLLYTDEGYQTLRKLLYTDELNRGVLKLAKATKKTALRPAIERYTVPRLSSSIDALDQALKRPGWEQTRQALIERFDEMDRIYDRSIRMNAGGGVLRDYDSEKIMHFTGAHKTLLRKIAEQQAEQLKLIDELAPRMTISSQGMPDALTADRSGSLRERALQELEAPRASAALNSADDLFPEAFSRGDLSSDIIPAGETRESLIRRTQQFLTTAGMDGAEAVKGSASRAKSLYEDFQSCYRNMPLKDHKAGRINYPESANFFEKASLWTQNRFDLKRNPVWRDAVTGLARSQAITLTGYTVSGLTAGGHPFSSAQELKAFFAKMLPDSETSAANSILKMIPSASPGPFYLRWVKMLAYDASKTSTIDIYFYKVDPRANHYGMEVDEAAIARRNATLKWNVFWGSPTGAAISVLAQGIQCAYPSGKVIAATNSFQFVWSLGTSSAFFAIRDHNMKKAAAASAERRRREQGGTPQLP